MDFLNIYYTPRYAAIQNRSLQMSYLRSISYRCMLIQSYPGTHRIPRLQCPPLPYTAHTPHSATVLMLCFCLWQVMHSKVRVGAVDGVCVTHG